MDKRFKVVPGVALVIERDNKVLLLRRSSASSWPGYYCTIGGHVDGNETMREAIVREAFEEVGIVVRPEDLTFLHVVHRYSEGGEIVTFFFKATHFTGEPYNKEPEKHDELIWAPYNDLPQPLFGTYESYLNNCGEFYSELDWEKCLHKERCA